MPHTNHKKPGDVFYPQHAVIKSVKVSAITITKGNLYTKDGTVETGDHLVVPDTLGFLHGIYQPRRNIESAGTAGQHTVQCFVPSSWIGLRAKVANLCAGMTVKYDYVTNKVDKWMGTDDKATPAENNSRIGKIYEIHTTVDGFTRKDVTDVNDVVVVQLGVF